MHPTPKYVLELTRIDRTKLRLTGGKAANLGELTRIEGIRVPDGFCISTEAFARVITVDDRLGRVPEFFPVNVHVAVSVPGDLDR